MDRATFLERIRTRLGRSAVAGAPVRDDRTARPTPATWAAGQLAERFQAELARVGGAAQRCASPEDLEARLIAFLHDSGVRSLVGFARRAFEGLSLARLSREFPAIAWQGGTEADAAGFRERVAASDAGLSIADLGVAATGSLVFLADPARPRAVTLLPRSHVAILRSSALVPDLASAFAWLERRGTPPSSALLVTGPSRTSDIENDLTLGVHGPAAVTVFLLD